MFCIIFTIPLLVTRSKLPVDVLSFVVKPSRITWRRFVNKERHRNVSFNDICFWIRFRILSFSRIRLSAMSSSLSELCLRNSCARMSLCVMFLYAEFSSNGNSGSSEIDCFCLMSLGRREGVALEAGWADVDNTDDVTDAWFNGSMICDCFISAPNDGTLERDRTICLGGGFKMLPRLRLFSPADESGSGMSSKSSNRRSSIGRSLASS